ncbi:MAG: flagellar hook-length control protein FliK [Sedimentibacter sp.]
MNVNMNLINLLTSQLQSNAVQNNNQFINIDKGAFVNLLNMVMAEKGTTNPAELSSITDLNANTNVNTNLMELLLVNNENNFSDVADRSISDDKVICCFEELNKDEKQESKKVNENLIGWFSGFNFANTLINNLDVETTDAAAGIINLYYDKNIKNIISFVKPNEFASIKDVTSDNQQVINDNAATSDIEIPIKENIQDISFLAEKLITQVESYRNKVKDERNIQLEFTENNKPVLEGYNKIIEVSDESSQIKNPVLSQVEDKIVYMSSGETEGTKHVTMELNPENMGKVDIKMTFENNKITVEIKVSNEETQKILSSNSEELAKVLNKSAETSVTVIVKPYESQYGRNPLDYDSQNNRHGRQRNNNDYYYDNNNDDSEEDSVFSQIINLRALKLNNAV